MFILLNANNMNYLHCSKTMNKRSNWSNLPRRKREHEDVLTIHESVTIKLHGIIQNKKEQQHLKGTIFSILKFSSIHYVNLRNKKRISFFSYLNVHYLFWYGTSNYNTQARAQARTHTQIHTSNTQIYFPPVT